MPPPRLFLAEACTTMILCDNARIVLSLAFLFLAYGLRVPACFQTRFDTNVDATTKSNTALNLRSPVRLPNAQRSPMFEKMKTVAAKSTVVEKMKNRNEEKKNTRERKERMPPTEEDGKGKRMDTREE